MMTVMSQQAAFFDSGPPFKAFLEKNRVPDTCRELAVQRRKVPRIQPAVSSKSQPDHLGVSLRKTFNVAHGNRAVGS